MQGLDWLILGIYFAVLIAIGIWASSKRKKGGSLFLAEHSLRWHHIGFSMWGTNVGPSMLIASASAGFTTGIVSGNYAWYAFVFIALLAFVFARPGSLIKMYPDEVDSTDDMDMSKTITIEIEKDYKGLDIF